MSKDLMNLGDLGADKLAQVLELAAWMKKNRGKEQKALAGKSIGLIFLKSSTRTRVSFEVGVNELGGSPLYLDSHGLQLGRGESYEDTARVLSRYLHGIVIRGHAHDQIAAFGKECSVPVINALTDRFHPCQLLADLQTVIEKFGHLKGLRVSFLGDTACNMGNSWILASQLCGFELRLGGPKGYQPDFSQLPSWVDTSKIIVTDDPVAAVKDCHVVNTDTWVSMGFEAEAADRLKALGPFQLNAELLAHADKSAIVMHCLPAYRGKEVTAEVLDGPRSVIWDEAENRLHAQKALMATLFK